MRLGGGVVDTVGSNLQEVGCLGSHFFCKRDDDRLSGPVPCTVPDASRLKDSGARGAESFVR